MSRRLTDEMLDAQLIAYLDDRAEDGAAQARTPEQLALEIAGRIRPTYRIDLRATRVLRLAWLAVFALLVLALLASLLAGGRLLSPPTRVVTIAIELPLGSGDPDAAPILNGIMLAVRDAGGRAGHFRIDVPGSTIFSDAVEGLPDASRGAANMRRIVADQDVVAVIGPFSSSVAYQQIPISSAAGLLQCSPASTDPQLTGTAGVEIQPVGSTAPEGGNYVRVVTTDDVAAVGAARYLFERLGKTSAYVVDDNDGNGIAMADWFEAEFTRLGGRVVSRARLPDSADTLLAMLASARTKSPQAIYFGGSSARGATLLTAASQAGMGDIAFVGSEALNDGSAATPGSFLSIAGDGARNAYSVFPGLANGPGEAAFESGYRALYRTDPPAFAAHGYACAQVVIAALRQVDGDSSASTTDLREAVRAAGHNPNAIFETILGPISFDSRGDVTPKRVSIYRYDAPARAWVYVDQIDSAPVFQR